MEQPWWKFEKWRNFFFTAFFCVLCKTPCNMVYILIFNHVWVGNKWYYGEPAISLHSYTVPLVQWSTRLLPVMRDPGSIPRGVLMWNLDSPVSVVSLHSWPWCDDRYGLVWGGLCPEPSLGCRANNVIILLDLTQLFYPGFTLAEDPPSGFTTDIVGCRGGALWRACNLTAFTHSSTLPEGHLFGSRHVGSGFNPQGGTYVWNRDSPVSDVSLQYFGLV